MPAVAQTAPSNDNFSLAIGIAGNRGNLTSSTLNASSEAGEPTHGSSNSGRSVWYRWTAPTSARVSFDTRGSAFDTTLGVYTGATLSGLSRVTENDDHAWADACCLQSRVTFDAVQGTSYAIAVAGFGGASGTFTLRWEIPPNDSFSNAEQLFDTSASATGSNVGASGEAGEPLHAGIGNSGSVWWTWAAPGSGPTQINTFGSNYDTTLAVYTGTSVAGLTVIAGNDDTDTLQSQVTFQAVAGTRYWIAVDGFGSSRGAIQLALSQNLGVAPGITSVPAAPAVVGLSEVLVGAVANGQILLQASGGSGSAVAAISCFSSGGIRIAAAPNANPGGTSLFASVAAGQSAPAIALGATAGSARFTGVVDCQVQPTGATPYSLQFTIAVPAGQQPAASLALNGTCLDNQDYPAGAAVTLSWDSAGMSTCSASATPAVAAWSGALALRGSRSLSLPVSTGVATFTLQCSGAAGSRSDSIAVDVTAPTTVSITTLAPLRDMFGLLDLHQHACVVHTDGAVSCWGSNDFGQLGNGNQFNQTLPTRVLGISTGARQVSGRRSHTCATFTNGTIKCWGSNTGGQLGDGTQVSRLTAADVLNLGGTASSVATGNSHTCAVLTSGALRCWGINNAGQLGVGDTQFRTSPTAVATLGNVRQVSASFQHTCAVTHAGAAFCWGDNQWGQLGDGTTTQRLVPTPVQGLTSGVIAISAGGGRSELGHSCALRSNGQVLCWGRNLRGELGDGSYVNSSVPRAVVGLSGATEISAGSEHTCANTASGPRCWGSNNRGELGNLGSLDSNTPVAVSVAGGGVAALTAGRFASCAKLGDSGLSCWGLNDLGTLGDNTFISRPTAAPVLSAVTTLGVVDVVTPTGNAASRTPTITGSGRYVVFESDATNLLAGQVDDTGTDIFLRDNRRPFCAPGGLRRVSENAAGTPIGGNAIEPSLSEDGSVVVFVAAAADVPQLSDETPKQAETRRKAGGHNICLRQMLTGSLQCVSTIPANTGGRFSKPQLSGNGRQVVWATDQGLGSSGSQIVSLPLAPQANGLFSFGTPRCLTCFGVDANGQDVPSQPASGPSRSPALSRDGEWLAFATQATNLKVAADKSVLTTSCPGASSRVYLRNILTGRVRELSTPAGGGSCGSAGQGCGDPSISSSGGAVAMRCDQPLAPGQQNRGVDNVYRWHGGTVQRVSARPNGADGDGVARSPSISGDGRVVSFSSNSFGLDGAVFSGPTALLIDAMGHAESPVPRRNPAPSPFPTPEPSIEALADKASGLPGIPLDVLAELPESKGADRMDVHLWVAEGGVRRLGTNTAGQELNGPSAGSALTYNGLDVVLESDASNVVTMDTNQATDVFGRSNPALLTLVFRADFD